MELGNLTRPGLSIPNNDELRRSLAHSRIIDATDAIWKVRMVKSSREIEVIRKACEITCQAYAYCFTKSRIGMTEVDVLGLLKKFMLDIYPNIVPWALINSSPRNYENIDGGPDDITLDKGNLLWIDGGCNYRGYWSDFSRVAVIGDHHGGAREIVQPNN